MIKENLQIIFFGTLLAILFFIIEFFTIYINLNF
jgi:hypothetical protein